MMIIKISANVSKLSNEEIKREILSGVPEDRALSILNESYNRNDIDAFYNASAHPKYVNNPSILKLLLNITSKMPQSPASNAIIDNILELCEKIDESLYPKINSIILSNPSIASTAILHPNTPIRIIDFVMGALHLNITNKTKLDNSPYLQTIIEDLKRGEIWHNERSGQIIISRIMQNPQDEFLIELCKYNIAPSVASPLLNASELYKSQSPKLKSNMDNNKNPGIELAKLISGDVFSKTPINTIISTLLNFISGEQHGHSIEWVWNLIKKQIPSRTELIPYIFGFSQNGQNLILKLIETIPNIIPEIIDMIKNIPNIDTIKRTKAYEELIHICLSNPSYRTKILELPENYFQMIRKTKENAQILEDHFHPKIKGIEELEELMGKNNNWYKTAQGFWYTAEMAANTTDPEILRNILRIGKDDSVSRYAARNPHCPPEVLAEVLRRGNDDSVSRNAAGNSNCPPEVLAEVLRRGNYDGVSCYAVENPNCSPEVAIKWFRLLRKEVPKDIVQKQKELEKKHQEELNKKHQEELEKKHQEELEWQELEKDPKAKEILDLLGKNKDWYIKYAISQEFLKEAGWKENIATSIIAALLMIMSGYSVEAASKKTNVPLTTITDALKNKEIMNKIEQIKKDKEQKNIPTDVSFNDIFTFITNNECYKNKQGQPILNLKAYLDPSKSNMSIGAGFNLDRPQSKTLIENMGLNYNRVRNGQQIITENQAKQLFKFDADLATSISRRFVNNFDQLPKDMKLVLIDMAYNMGENRLSQFKKLKKAIEEEDYLGAANELRNSKWFTQVKNRGKRSIDLITQLTPSISSQPLASL